MGRHEDRARRRWCAADRVRWPLAWPSERSLWWKSPTESVRLCCATSPQDRRDEHRDPEDSENQDDRNRQGKRPRCAARTTNVTGRFPGVGDPATFDRPLAGPRHPSEADRVEPSRPPAGSGQRSRSSRSAAGAAVGARPAAGLLPELQLADRHRPVDRLAHVVDGERGDRSRRSAPPSRRRCGRRCRPGPRPRRGRPRCGSSRRPSRPAAGGTAGSRFGVCLAAWMPATRATASTSPLVIAPDAILDAVSASMCTRQRATARRWVASLAVTSTMRARPSGSRCVNSEADMEGKSTMAAESPRPGDAHGQRPERNAAAQPPIWLIERSGRTKSTWPMRWPAHLVPTARSIAAASRSSRSGRRARRRAQDRPGGRSRRARTGTCGTCPSAVRRTRSQLLAERLGDARDHADVADAVGVAEPLGGLDVLGVARTRDGQVLEREHRVDALEDLAGGHDLVAAPLARRRRAA